MSTATINRTIKSRTDLSFTNFESGGNACNWSVPHDNEAYWHNDIKMGEYLFAEVAKLAENNELEAFDAISFAMNNPGWKTNGWGIEKGFSMGLAAAAIIGLRFLRQGAENFDYETLVRLRLESDVEAEAPKKRKKKS